MAFELPEAITIARQMHAEINGKTITQIHLSDACASLIRQGFINLHQVDLEDHIVALVTSRGKWVFLNLEPEFYLLFALETSGKLLYHYPDLSSFPGKYHVKVSFSDGSSLIESITGWGWAKAFSAHDLVLQRYPGKLGPSPVSEEFTFPYLCQVLDARANKNIKFILLQQDQIAGLGNGYLQDILFKAGLHPARKAGVIGDQEREELFRAILEVIGEAIRLDGSQFEVDIFNHPGGYHRRMGEHMKGQPCPVCGTVIQKITVLGTSSYICPSCQNL